MSIPDELFADAEEAAARLGFNRSQLYAAALAAFIADQDDDPVTTKLNELAADLDTSPDPAVDAIGRELIDGGAWQW